MGFAYGGLIKRWRKCILVRGWVGIAMGNGRVYRVGKIADDKGNVWIRDAIYKSF